jgi:hypothetical protein
MSTPYQSPDESLDESLDESFDESPEGIPGSSLPLNKVFRVAVNNAHYPTTYKATLNMSLYNSKPPRLIAAYNVVDPSNTNILSASVIIIPTSLPVGFQFQFTVNRANQEQVAAGYITGTYTFFFPAPGSTVSTFSGLLTDPYRGNPDGTNETWTATDNPGDPDDDEVS